MKQYFLEIRFPDSLSQERGGLDLAIQVLINVFIAFLWMFLQDSQTPLTFVTGYIIGVIILYFLRRFFTKPFYIHTFIAAVKLFFIFIYESILSAILMMKYILQPKLDVRPGIFRIDTDLEGEVEITLISMLITLTPGSVVVEVTPDNKSVYVHAMDVREAKESVLKSQKIFEKAIKDVTRK